ncbi:hypothetical protein [Psychrobacter aquimaris]|uniref:hypothetical protein n=1 Tax=Psychrobacter aquimaris TaxID=292733 RepID=UPI0018DF1495|nr:hypothetical protein [Psychrobacter aquimaris]
MKEYSDDELQLRLKRLRERVELKQANYINAYHDIVLMEKISDEIASRNDK